MTTLATRSPTPPPPSSASHASLVRGEEQRDEELQQQQQEEEEHKVEDNVDNSCKDNEIAVIDSDDDDDDDSDGDIAESVFHLMKAEKMIPSSSKSRPGIGNNNNDSGGNTGNSGNGGVRFGSVRVHKHNLTLGDNPSTKTAGPPLMLDWDVEESLRFSNIDEFAIKQHGKRDSLVVHSKPKSLSTKTRSKIASLDHSAGSIRKLQTELYEIKQHRLKSKSEDIVRALEKEEEEEAKKKNNRRRGGGGGLSSIFTKIFHQKK